MKRTDSILSTLRTVCNKREQKIAEKGLQPRGVTAQNKEHQKDKSEGYTSKYVGVCRIKRKNEYRWKVRITVNYKQIVLGVFMDEEEAARCYDKAALIIYGEFAKTNFPLKENEAK